MSFTDRLFEENKALWNMYLSHPFIEGMKDGSLPIEAFKYYLIQDYHYLLEYTKVFAIGLSKSKGEKDLVDFSESISNIAWETSEVHKKYMRSIGITEDEIKDSKVSYSNVMYTSYMLAKANDGDEINSLAAVLSCSWSYAFIGQNILKSAPDLTKDNIYGEWVKAYSSKDYDEMNKKLMQTFDKKCEGLSKDRLNEISDIFRICSECEYRFWDMAYTMGACDKIGERKHLGAGR